MTGRVRGWRLPVVVVLIVVLGGGVIAFLGSGQPPSGYLDPASTGPSGGHALAAILTGRGTPVIAVTTATAAVSAASARPGSTILITSPSRLNSDDLRAIERARSSLVLTDPDAESLTAVAPEVSMTGTVPVSALDPGCQVPAARLAGNADLGGVTLASTARSARHCYLSTLVRYPAAGREITVLGTGQPFTNGRLAQHGNAALALNLLSASGGPVVWLTPAGQPVPVAQPASFTSLIPAPVYMVTAEIGIAVVLLALWRARRLGPLVPERLPVVVRAAETTEGHGRLYHARRARDRAAQALRTAAITRMRPGLGLPPDAPAADVAAAAARRGGLRPDEVAALLDGPPPADEAALVALADKLDELESGQGGQ